MCPTICRPPWAAKTPQRCMFVQVHVWQGLPQHAPPLLPLLTATQLALQPAQVLPGMRASPFGSSAASRFVSIQTAVSGRPSQRVLQHFTGRYSRERSDHWTLHGVAMSTRSETAIFARFHPSRPLCCGGRMAPPSRGGPRTRADSGLAAQPVQRQRQAKTSVAGHHARQLVIHVQRRTSQRCRTDCMMHRPLLEPGICAAVALCTSARRRGLGVSIHIFVAAPQAAIVPAPGEAQKQAGSRARAHANTQAPQRQGSARAAGAGLRTPCAPPRQSPCRRPGRRRWRRPAAARRTQSRRRARAGSQS